MNNNIFVKKEKFNPDISSKFKSKEQERTDTKFNISTQFYNPITNIIPPNIKTSNDLLLQKDNTITNIKQLIINKSSERELQDNEFKPQKTKITNNDTNCNYIETPEELKVNAQKTKPKTNNSNYNNILDNLKDLGIIS